MARYFMGDTRLGWLERMMMEPPKPPRPNTAPRQKGRQHRPRQTTTSAPKRSPREGGV